MTQSANKINYKATYINLKPNIYKAYYILSEFDILKKKTIKMINLNMYFINIHLTKNGFNLGTNLELNLEENLFVYLKLYNNNCKSLNIVIL